MNKEYYRSGTKRQAVGAGTDTGHDVSGDAVQPVVCERDTEEAERREMQHEILNRLVRALGSVMRSAKNPALAWAIVEGVFIDQKTVTEICDEMDAPQQTGADYLARLCKALKDVAR